MKVGLLHYTGPPTIGGVESTLAAHARLLAEAAYQPMLVVGRGQPFDDRVPVWRIPALDSRDPSVVRVRADLERGTVSQDFDALRCHLVEQLSARLSGLDALIVHNALTLHKNLAATAALWDLHQAANIPRLIGWHHDLAWDRPQDRGVLHDGYPWDLLRRPWPGVIHVVVSAAQQRRLAALYDIDPELIHVIPPGVDPAAFGRWTDRTQRIVERCRLLEADAVLLLPARITRRKNIEFALRVLAALRQPTGKDVRLIVSGPPGPHTPANQAYLEQLLDLRHQLGLNDAAHFLYQLDAPRPLEVDDATLSDLFRLSDALFMPSISEGFGIPLLEAGLARLPIFCTELPPFAESAGELATYFSPAASPSAVADIIATGLFDEHAYRMRRRVLQEYSWQRIVQTKLLPLLDGVAAR
ncbi:MAG: glycosyltransferase family 4 protein [Chloroflexota bacterium]